MDSLGLSRDVVGSASLSSRLSERVLHFFSSTPDYPPRTPHETLRHSMSKVVDHEHGKDGT